MESDYAVHADGWLRKVKEVGNDVDAFIRYVVVEQGYLYTAAEVPRGRVD